MKALTCRAAVVVVLALVLVPGLPHATGADWPMFGRDATRNAVSPEKNAPVRWQIEQRERGALVKPAFNVKWQSELGNNFASPVVAGGLVWVGTNNFRPRDPKVKGDAAVLMCFREADGKFLWHYVSPRLDNFYQDYPHSSINCSPLAEGDRLYFTTNRAEVVCLDIGLLREGKGDPRLLWKLDMRKELSVSPVGAAMNIGFTCSIGASYKGRVYVTTGNGVREDDLTLPAPKAPSLLCLDKESGKVLWSDSSPGKDILHSQGSSPLVVEVQGKAQAIVAQGDGWVRSFDARTGELLWKFDTNPKSAVWKPVGRGTKNYLPATPVFHEGRVYIANGQDMDNGPGVGHLWCIDPARTPKNKDKDLSPVGDSFDPAAEVNKESGLVWHYGGPVVPKPKEGEPEWVFGRTMSSVAVHDGLVVAVELSGFVHCLDARTGKRYWTYDANDNVTASPLIVDGKVYVSTSGGNVAVLALSREKRLLAENDVDDSAYSSPVFANGTLYLAVSGKLLAIRARGADGKAGDRPPGHWPQWRGPDRSNVSRETGLLQKWPEGGPPLAWKASGLGEGVASVAVAGGRVFTLGYRGEDERVTALDEATGNKLWDVRIGPALKENPLMRWMCQRTPTVDDDRLYAFTARGELVCLQSADGKELWRKDYTKDFEGKTGPWGYCDRPLVDGDRLICVPGNANAAVVALNKKTGDVIWKCAVPDGHPAGYAATVVAEVGGVRQYLAFPLGGVVAVSAEGKLLWRYDRMGVRIGNSYTPLVHGDHVFCASGYGAGIALVKLVADKDKGEVRVEEVYARKLNLPPWHDGAVRVGDHVYVGTGRELACLEFKTGKEVWKDAGAVGGTVSPTWADGHLYLRSQEGKVALVEATPKGYTPKGLLKIPEAVDKRGSTAPVVAGGRLYLRDDDRLFCYDVQGSAAGPAPAKEGEDKPGKTARPPRDREAHDVFVPTPQDVVERMLELVKVKREEVVYDLGCGDGRIVATAARKYGCKAYGCDIDPECVKLSRETVEKQGVGRLVTIEKKDLFELDLSGADVVTLYLLPRTNERLIPQLKKLKPGARVVTHAFGIPGIRPDRVVTWRSEEDDLEHEIYIYTAPLQAAESGK
jgi:outer membrane protein assembly factor BamB/precorrin-6B methylase 2